MEGGSEIPIKSLPHNQATFPECVYYGVLGIAATHVAANDVDDSSTDTCSFSQTPKDIFGTTFWNFSQKNPRSAQIIPRQYQVVSSARHFSRYKAKPREICHILYRNGLLCFLK